LQIKWGYKERSVVVTAAFVIESRSRISPATLPAEPSTEGMKCNEFVFAPSSDQLSV
jgi:hypothetical protein